MSILTVSQLNNYIGFKLKSDPKLKTILVEGEISNFTLHYKSGHMYFSLQDGSSSIKAVMFASNASRLKFMPENGMNVIAMGNIDIYEKEGTYQLYAVDIRPTGTGGNHVALEKLKQKLEAEGLFNSEFKKPLPLFPKRIGAVTSASGAALHDLINVIGRRYPLCEITFYPTIVQGSEAPYSIAENLTLADNNGNDTLILCRGGGSSDDLLAFNTEIVARSIFACNTPIISAVGHETDFTIADFTADMRAPTPSAAAELAVPDISVVYNYIKSFSENITAVMSKQIAEKSLRLELISARLNRRSPENALEHKLSEVELLSKSITDKVNLILQNKSSAVESLEKSLSDKMNLSLKYNEQMLNEKIALLSSLNPLAILSRGYSLAYKEEKLITDVSELKIGDEVKIKMSGSEFLAAVTKI